ncbi:MAG TPA: hypothetical protein VHD81_09860 [Mycobacteriales bacterium]|nr:hypothetical protein [Mycobacteriales bacterium]
MGTGAHMLNAALPFLTLVAACLVPSAATLQAAPAHHAKPASHHSSTLTAHRGALGRQ